MKGTDDEQLKAVTDKEAEKPEAVEPDAAERAESSGSSLSDDSSVGKEGEPSGGDDEKVSSQTDPDTDSFDYVVPKEIFKAHAKRKHRSNKNKGNTRSATQEEMEEAEAGYVFAVPHKRKWYKRIFIKSHHHGRHRHMPLWQRVLMIIGLVLLAVIIAFGGTFLVLNEIGRRSMHSYDGLELVPPTEDESGSEIIRVDNSGRVITYEGVSYELNEDIISVTFIGTDDGSAAVNSDLAYEPTELFSSSSDKNASAETDLQMADAVYIMTADTKTGKIKILGVSRDTMTDVDLYSEQGRFIDTRRMQLAFSYAYDSDNVTGGKNTVTSLSRLFYGLPFENYFAINMKALITLNDTIGGVTLTSSMTFNSPIDNRLIKEGDTVTLHGREADYYVRYRDVEQLDSNNDRMKRQQEYIRAFMESLIPAAKKDISVVSQLYNDIQVNSETSLDLPKITYIASTALTKLSSASDIDYVSLKGTVTEGDYAELNVSNENAIRTMLDVFYRPLADAPDISD